MIPRSHPRYASLMQRHLIEEGIKHGIVTTSGMIAQGRGETFDYLLGERTHPAAKDAIRASAAMLLLARYPVLSANGNTTALCARDFVKLAGILKCPIEVNLFYATKERKKRIAQVFKKFGFEILGVKTNRRIPHLDSARGKVSDKGIWRADVVFVPLEDGDRTESLRRMGKKVIVVDLNPRSRSAVKASITIVDNVVRAMPLLIKETEKLKKKNKKQLMKIVRTYNNKKNLKNILNFMRKGV